MNAGRYFLIMLAMAFGLIVPRMCIEHFYPGLPPK